MNFPDLGICTDLENAAVVASAGAGFLEVSVQNFLVPDDDDARFAPHLGSGENAGPADPLRRLLPAR